MYSMQITYRHHKSISLSWKGWFLFQTEGIGPRIANDIWRENNKDEEIPLLNCDTLECLWQHGNKK